MNRRSQALLVMAAAIAPMTNDEFHTPWSNYNAGFRSGSGGVNMTAHNNAGFRSGSGGVNMTAHNRKKAAKRIIRKRIARKSRATNRRKA